MAVRSYDDHMKHVHQTWRENRVTQRALDHAMRTAIADGVAYTDLARAVEKSEASVRQLAKRRGWAKAGDRRRMPEGDVL